LFRSVSAKGSRRSPLRQSVRRAPAISSIASPGVDRRPEWPDLAGSPRDGRPAGLREELRDQPLKVVDAVLALRVEAPPVVGTGPEPTLDVLAQRDVFLLDLVGEGDGLLHRLPAWSGARLCKEPFEDRQRLVDA